MNSGEVDEDPILESNALGEISTIVSHVLLSFYVLMDRENKAKKRPGILGLMF